ncbi:hypothetical protein OG746_26945 [Streptomyces sp. NBC_01016]|uniref:hypothetical protein n=1 Tax=Streptomyces sp. NBC_01016 TaxID=2903720 RepID=UPI002251F142|nr:hypothetical protein [Streptomyces sp. NBC_01016]MCX4827131.1 hypothetical protein [Streptomyces sp. NBC_01016]MCX4832380.1 hypothetical protein [Streptomyces sp. NBC_01016]
MSNDRMPVDGPYRIYVDATPTGATLDVTAFVRAVVLNLASAADEDGESLLDDLVEIAELERSAGAQGPDSHAAHERDERVERLLQEVAGDAKLPVYGGQVARLAGSLARIAAPRPVPGQRGAA